MDAVRTELAVEGGLVHQVIQVGEGLTEGEAHLVPVEGSPEQDPHQFDSGLRDLARDDHLVAPRSVVRGKAVDPSVQPEKREIVRRQDKRLGRYRSAQFGQGTRDNVRGDRRRARVPGR